MVDMCLERMRLASRRNGEVFDSMLLTELPKIVTENLTSQLELPKNSLRMYKALHTVAVEVAKYRDYHPKVGQVSFHIPAEIVAKAIGIHRSTLYVHLRYLKGRGLVDARAHRTTFRGQTRADGTVWSVKLHPSRGKSARVSWQDLKHRWRDLEADTVLGRTAWNEIRQSDTERTRETDLELLLSWALPRNGLKTPLNMTVGFGVESVLDVPFSRKEERGKMVDGAARAVASFLGDDSSNLNFYRWFLWQLLRLEDRGQGGYWHQVHTMLLRSKADREDGFARSAGALFVSRLKKWDLWNLLKATPPYPVGTPPP